MSNVELTKLSSKGQIVLPQDIREELNAKEGTVFAVFGSRDTVVLKKIEKPSKESLLKELKTMAIEGKKRLEKKGLKESDIPAIVQKSRGN